MEDFIIQSVFRLFMFLAGVFFYIAYWTILGIIFICRAFTLILALALVLAIGYGIGKVF